MALEADGWDPSGYHQGQVVKLPWRCSKGHTWSAQIVARTKQNQGCPVCINRAINVGVNDLATTFPDLAAQIVGTDPTTVTSSTSRKVTWECSEGHQWEESPQKRAKGYGCPFCSNRRLLVGWNDLATVDPELAREADGWDPTTVKAGGTLKVSWRCPKGHTYVASPVARRRGRGCAVCAGKQINVGANDLASRFPLIAAEANGWDPTTVTAGSHKSLSWRCAEGHVYENSPHMRTGRQNQGCPYCAGRRVQPGFNDLATTHPQLAAEADGWDPSRVSAGSHTVLDWRCSHGHTFRANPNQRTSRTSNCPTCANLVILPGFNDLATTHPELAAQAAGWDPTTVGGGSSQRLTWRCSSGHEWQSTPINRTWNATGCPICANQLVQPGYNDLATLYPDIAAQAVGWDPTTEIGGSKHKKKWRCELGHEWTAIIQNRTLNGAGCPYCGNDLAWPGFNDLATKYPEVAAQAIGWDPTTVVFGSRKKLPWRCPEGHEWRAVVANRTIQGQGCPSCASTGYDPNEPAWLYLLSHPTWHMQQVGITNRPKQRMAAHKSNGWEPVDIRGPMDGHLAQNWENDILRYLRRNGAILVASSRGLQPSRPRRSVSGGEAWWTSDYTASSVHQLMQDVDDSDAR